MIVELNFVWITAYTVRAHMVLLYSHTFTCTLLQTIVTRPSLGCIVECTSVKVLDYPMNTHTPLVASNLPI